MIKELINIYFFYWYIPLSILVFFYILWDEHLSDNRKPKYRLDKNGYVQFYYRRYSYWFNFPIWNDNDEERLVEVNDQIRKQKYTISYVGPGRAKLKLIFDNENPISDEFITDHVRKLYPEFKNSNQLYNLYNLYVDKENIMLNKIVDNHIFKAQ